MDIGRTDLFDLAEQRLVWAARRQSLLAQNIANAATPGFVPKDLPSFARTLAHAGAAPLARTEPNHLAGLASASPLAGQAAQPTARSADGNGVALDQQLSKVADTETTQALVTSIYHRYLSFFSLALGRTS